MPSLFFASLTIVEVRNDGKDYFSGKLFGSRGGLPLSLIGGPIPCNFGHSCCS
jgi:hypothetical protein